jgi:uncharacterized protein (DUF1697 family)
MERSGQLTICTGPSSTPEKRDVDQDRSPAALEPRRAGKGLLSGLHGHSIAAANPSTEKGASLPTYIALLRGINLGGHKKVSMADLRTLFAGLGAEEVATYLQSGNVVFKSSVASPHKLVEAIEEQITADLKLDVQVLLRTKPQLAKTLAANPFAKRRAETSKLHVTFLADKPARGRVDDLDAKAGGRDEFRIVGREIYLRCPGGYGRTKLNNAFFEKRLGVAATTRNWKTVTKLAELAST